MSNIHSNSSARPKTVKSLIWLPLAKLTLIKLVSQLDQRLRCVHFLLYHIGSVKRTGGSVWWTWVKRICDLGWHRSYQFYDKSVTDLIFKRHEINQNLWNELRCVVLGSKCHEQMSVTAKVWAETFLLKVYDKKNWLSSQRAAILTVWLIKSGCVYVLPGLTLPNDHK